MSFSKSNMFCRARVGNDCQLHRGSRVPHAASVELGDVHNQAVPRRLIAAAEDESEVVWTKFERGDICLPARLRNRMTITRSEHLK